MAEYLEVFGVYTELPLNKPRLRFLALAEYSLRMANHPVQNLPAREYRQRKENLKKIEQSHRNLMNYIADQSLADYYMMAYRGLMIYYLEKPCFQYFGYWVRTPFISDSLMLLAQGNLKNKRMSRTALFELSKEMPNGFDDLEMLIDQDNEIVMKEFRHVLGTLKLTTHDPDEAQKLSDEFVSHYEKLIPIFNRHVHTELYCRVIPDIVVSIGLNLLFLSCIMLILHASDFSELVFKWLSNLFSLMT